MRRGFGCFGLVWGTRGGRQGGHGKQIMQSLVPAVTLAAVILVLVAAAVTGEDLSLHRNPLGMVGDWRYSYYSRAQWALRGGEKDVTRGGMGGGDARRESSLGSSVSPRPRGGNTNGTYSSARTKPGAKTKTRPCTQHLETGAEGGGVVATRYSLLATSLSLARSIDQPATYCHHCLFPPPARHQISQRPPESSEDERTRGRERRPPSPTSFVPVPPHTHSSTAMASPK